VVVHIKHTSTAGGAVVRTLWFVDMANETVLPGGILQPKTLTKKRGTHCRGTRPGSVRMVCTIDHMSRMKMRL
jgi:hypothetical protein